MASIAKTAFLQGARDGLVFWPVIGPFSMLFGAVAIEAGIGFWQTMAMTVVVIAGASQFTALQLMSDGSGFWLALAGALAVNLRMAMYSAALVPHLGHAPLWQRIVCSYLMFDQPYALSVLRYEAHPAEPMPAKVGYYVGIGLPMALFWTLLTAVGARLGRSVPDSWALDFMLPLTFLSLVGPMIRTPAHAVAAATSVAVALPLSGLPSGTGLLIAAALAMVAGATAEVRGGRRGIA